MTEEEKNDLFSDMKDIVKKYMTVLPTDEYMEQLKSSSSVLVCSPYSSRGQEISREMFSEEIAATLTTECGICGVRIMYGKINECASFKICINCAIKYSAELTDESLNAELKGESDGTQD
jgi:hypothetical protein